MGEKTLVRMKPAACRQSWVTPINFPAPATAPAIAIGIIFIAIMIITTVTATTPDICCLSFLLDVLHAAAGGCGGGTSGQQD